MPCYHPVRAWRAKRPDAEGKRGIVFSLASASVTEPLSIPCGKCIGCNLLRARGWSLRCMNEASLHDLNCVVTLTYEKAKESLSKRDFQLFMKRLRKFVEPVRISFFASGEYGTLLGRPHYHAILFGMDFLDKREWKDTGRSKQYVSSQLDKLWGLGYATVGDVNVESASYVAGYTAKKAGLSLSLIDADGVISEREPEFRLMSRRPAIGRRWIDKFLPDVYPDDFCIRDGRETGVPRYYDKRLEACDATLFAAVKAERLGAMLSDEAWKDAKPSRLLVREMVAEAKLNLRKGNL